MSFLWLTIQSALRVLRRNPLRAGLTMLGIVIGVGAVVGMVSLGQGATASVQREIASLGTNVLIIIPGATTTGGVRGGLGSVSTLTVDDARDIEKRIGDISLVTYASRSVLQVIHEHKNWNTIALGTTTAFPDLRNWPVADGNFFTQADEDAAAKVVVLGKTVADNLFERGEEVIGAQIRVKNVPLRVIGILSPKGQSLSGQDQDDIVVLPFTTAERKVLGTKFLGTVGIIMVATQHRYSIPAAVEEIKELLRARHRIHPAEENDFTIRTMEDVAKTVAGASRTMMVMLLSIASISLIVGGIGIMNILLVSVTERTREIGIRMAVGAKRAHILLQFLVEAIILTAIGGVAGVIFGIAGARLLTRLIGWPTIISSQAVAVAFLFSLAVGIFFGLYPANKASRMNPIEALHYE
ncbi:MAG TPA: ABC transporter permease [Nitrospira sp.]|jgi:putative ABC transport system permease protein|nr:ABC transporter permease [Nitrospira sp.]HNP80248.1 ABC transporter permease [Nitrospira sp.]